MIGIEMYETYGINIGFAVATFNDDWAGGEIDHS